MISTGIAGTLRQEVMSNKASSARVILETGPDGQKKLSLAIIQIQLRYWEVLLEQGG
jgi:hypothetical protein